MFSIETKCIQNKKNKECEHQLTQKVSAIIRLVVSSAAIIIGAVLIFFGAYRRLNKYIMQELQLAHIPLTTEFHFRDVSYFDSYKNRK